MWGGLVVLCFGATRLVVGLARTRVVLGLIGTRLVLRRVMLLFAA